MVELFLDRFQVVKDIGVIELKAVEDQRTRAVMDNRAFVEKAQSYPSASITKQFRPDAPKLKVPGTPPITNPGLQTALFQNPGRHSCRGGFAVYWQRLAPSGRAAQNRAATADLTYKDVFPVPLPHTDFTVMALPIITRSGCGSSWHRNLNRFNALAISRKVIGGYIVANRYFMA